MNAERLPLQPIIAPKAVAVIGASRRENSLGRQIVHNIITSGFTGALYPVNPTATSICSIHAHARVADIPEPVDAAVIVVPKERVVDVAEECGAAGVRGLIVISSGFREIGPEGAERERCLLEVARRHGMRMVGPNCMGVINNHPDIAMNATFANASAPFGGAAFVSQSGAVGFGVLDYARDYGIGISQFISVGNKADVSGNDLLEHWEHDESVRLILMYMESFGNPRHFLEIAGRITKRKPIIVVKAGRSTAGAKAAASHTGALAASDAAVDAMLVQAGVLRASTVEELFDMAMAFETHALPRSRRTAVLTNAGGPGVLAADALEAAGMQIVELSEPTVDALRPLFPVEASIRNPLDMIASATPSGYQLALESLLRDPSIDAVVPIFVPPFGVKQEDVANAIAGAARTNREKPVLAVLMGRDGLPRARAELQKAGIPTYIFPESATRGLATLNRQVEWSSRASAALEPIANVDRAAAAEIVDTARRECREHLTQVEALQLLAAYRIPIVRSGLARDVESAVKLAEEVAYPVALKIVSPDVVHKTEVGGVIVGIADEDELRDAHEQMMMRIGSALPNARVEGVLVQQMLTGGLETIVGVTRDPSFGPLVMFGLGGVLVEALRDVVFRIAPIGDPDAHAMIASLRATRLFDGVRGGPPADKTAIASVIRHVAQLAIDFPMISELDVNPLHVRGGEVVALDARARVSIA